MRANRTIIEENVNKNSVFYTKMDKTIITSTNVDCTPSKGIQLACQQVQSSCNVIECSFDCDVYLHICINFNILYSWREQV